MPELRHTRVDDFPVIRAAEADSDTGRWLGPLDTSWHRQAMDDPDREHLIVAQGDQIVGFLVLSGLHDRNNAVCIQRMVILPDYRGRGLGRHLLSLATEQARRHRAHRVWLYVKPENTRARTLYSVEGFAEEGILRDALKEPDGSYSSLVVMSILEHEIREGHDRPNETVST